jgi:hypothetical protein
MGPSRVATFDTTRRTMFTTAQAGSGLVQWVQCMRARRFRKQARLRCMPTQTPVLSKRPIAQGPARHLEYARDVARSFADTEDFEKLRRQRKKIEMRFAHLERILKLGRLRLRGPRAAQDELVLAAIA